MGALFTFKERGSALQKNIQRQYLLSSEKDYVPQELVVSFTEHKKYIEKKKYYLSTGMGPPWKVGPVDLVTPVSMVQPLIVARFNIKSLLFFL